MLAVIGSGHADLLSWWVVDKKSDTKERRVESKREGKITFFEITLLAL